MCLETKFYIFLNFFTIYEATLKIVDPTVTSDFTVLLSHRWINDFQSGLINSKKIQKNVKFGIQTHINMENRMNGSDRLFEF